jgi:hypothetical protein
MGSPGTAHATPSSARPKGLFHSTQFASMRSPTPHFPQGKWGVPGLRMLRQAPLALKGCFTQRSSLASAVLEGLRMLRQAPLALKGCSTQRSSLACAVLEGLRMLRQAERDAVKRRILLHLRGLSTSMLSITMLGSVWRKGRSGSSTVLPIIWLLQNQAGACGQAGHMFCCEKVGLA